MKCSFYFSLVYNETFYFIGNDYHVHCLEFYIQFYFFFFSMNRITVNSICRVRQNFADNPLANFG